MGSTGWSSSGSDPEPVDAHLLKLIGMMGVVVIQEGEKGPFRPPPVDNQSSNSRLTSAAVFRFHLKSQASCSTAAATAGHRRPASLRGIAQPTGAHPADD